MLFAPVAGCGGTPATTFAPVNDVTSVVVHNARGIFRPQTIRDASTVRRLVEIMNRYNDGWSTETKSNFGTGDRNRRRNRRAFPARHDDRVRVLSTIAGSAT